MGEVGLLQAETGQDGFAVGFRGPAIGAVHLSGEGDEFVLESGVVRGLLEGVSGVFVGEQQAHLRGVAVEQGFENGQVVVKGRFLGEILHADAPPDVQVALVGRFHPGQDAEKGGFAAPVGADQPDPVAAVDKHVHLIKQDAVGVLFGEGLEGEEVHSGGIVMGFEEKRGEYNQAGVFSGPLTQESVLPLCV